MCVCVCVCVLGAQFGGSIKGTGGLIAEDSELYTSYTSCCDAVLYVSLVHDGIIEKNKMQGG